MSRKWFFILLTGVLVFALAACYGAAEVNPQPGAEEIPQGTPVETNADSAEGHDDDADMDAEEGQDDDANDDSEEEAAIIDAAALYSANCSRCHGAEREGGGGPPLLPSTLTGDPSRYVNTITTGSGPMPAWGNKLSVDEINALVEFLMNEPQ